MKKLLLLTLAAVLFISQSFAQGGNVGIGNNNPQTKLQVQGAISVTPVDVMASTSPFVLGDNLSIVRITDNSNAGANGTALVATPKEGQYLTIYNADAQAVTFAGYTIAASTGVISLNYIGGAWRLVSDNTSAPSSGSGSYIQNNTIGSNFATGQSASFDITGNTETGGTATIGGNVGIGTTSTANTLDVQGGTGIGTNNGTNINLQAQNGGTGGATSGGNINISPGTGNGGGANGVTSINAASGNVNIATGSAAQAVNINTGAANKTTTIGSTTGSSATTINAGSGGVTVSTLTNGGNSYVKANSTGVLSPQTGVPGTDVTGTVGNATTAANFSGSLAGDVSGTQGATKVNALESTGSPVNISSAAPPSVGQVLKATSATTATWQADNNTGGTVTQVNTGAGLTGGPITTTGTISIANGGVTNTMLANPSLTVTAGTGMSGGGSVPLGSSVTLNNAGVISNAAGSGISVSGATGAVTITNTGVTSIAAGSGISVNGSTGAVTVSATGSGLTGASTTNYVPKWTTTSGTSGTLSSTSSIYDNGTTVGIGSVTNLNNKLDVAGQIGVGVRNPTPTVGGAANWGNAVVFSGGTGLIAGYDSDNSDPLWMSRYNSGANTSELRMVIGDDPTTAGDKLVIGAMSGSPNYSTAGTWTPYYTFQMDGNFGIGNTGPTYKLDVSGDINTTTGYRVAGTATVGNYLRGNGSQFVSSAIQSGDLPSGIGSAWQRTGTYVTLINSGDNVGIGNANPGYKLDVNGQMRAERYNGINSLVLNTPATVNPASNVYLYSQGNDRDSWIYLDAADVTSNWGIYHRQIDAAVTVGSVSLPGNSIAYVGGGANAVQAYIGLTNGQAFFNGSVGIGVSSPGEKLDIAGNINLQNVTTGRRDIRGTMGDNDYWSVGANPTGTNAGVLEIATGDDGQTAGAAEPIVVRQYGPGTPWTGTLVRTGYLLDSYGNTQFPGTVKVGAYTLPNTDGSNGQVLKTNGSGALTWSADNNSGADNLGNHIATTRIQPTVGNSAAAGFYWPTNPGGGSGDEAWMRYYVRSGEATTLELGINNDADDDIALMPSGNVGVGVIAPAYKLDVVGDINTSSGYRVGGTAANGSYLRGNGAQFVSSAIQVGDIPSGNGNYIQNQFGSAQTAEYYINGRGRLQKSLYVSMDNTTGGGIVISDDGDIVDNNDGFSSHRFSYGIRIMNGNGTAGTVVGAQIAGNSSTYTYFNAGNVGIGTITPASKLHISGGAPTGLGGLPANTVAIIENGSSNNYLTFRNTADNGTYAGIQFEDNNVGGYIAFKNYGSGNSDDMIYGAYQDHVFQNGTTGTVDGNTETMRIKQNGNVGIGTSDPQGYKLYVNGPTYINGNYLMVASEGRPALRVGAAWGISGIYNGSDNVVVGTESAYNIYLTTAGNHRLTVQGSTGYVGINTTTPTAQLQVNGDARFGCRSGFWAVGDGRICVESGNPRGPSGVWTAIGTCKTVGPGSRVCTHTDMQEACGAGYNPYIQSDGWYGDHGVSSGGNWDDEYGTWNSASCADNNDGPAHDGGEGLSKYYRCCY